MTSAMILIGFAFCTLAGFVIGVVAGIVIGVWAAFTDPEARYKKPGHRGRVILRGLF